MEGKNRVIILNCCPLGKSEVNFWNDFIASFTDKSYFTFLSTSPTEGIKADDCIRVRYDVIAFPDMPAKPTGDLAALIKRVADKQKIWELYEEGKSQQLAYSWLVFWTLLLRTMRPVAVIAWNGHHVPESALREVCELESVDFVYAERGPLADTFALDRLGVNCQSSFNSYYEEICEATSEDRVRRFKEIYFAHGQSNWEQPRRSNTREEFRNHLGVSGNKKIIFFPAQVDRDINSKLFSPFFVNSYDAYSQLVEWCNRNSEEVFLIAKKHPKQEQNQAFQNLHLESGKWTDDVNIFDCIELSDAVVSINSSAAVEAALAGKPVLLLGHSLLGHWNGVLKVRSASDFADALETLMSYVRTMPNQSNADFFSKLLFGYLYSVKDEFVDLGLRHVSSFTFLPQRESRDMDLVLETSIKPLRPIIPSAEGAIFQLNALEGQLHIKNEQIRRIHQNRWFRLLARFGLINRS